MVSSSQHSFVPALRPRGQPELLRDARLQGGCVRRGGAVLVGDEPKEGRHDLQACVLEEEQLQPMVHQQEVCQYQYQGRTDVSLPP